MMQKVRVLISALLSFTGLFHLFFSFPLRYFFYCSGFPFLSPGLRWKNGLATWVLRALGVIYMGLLGEGVGLANGRQGDPTCTDVFSV